MNWPSVLPSLCLLMLIIVQLANAQNNPVIPVVAMEPCNDTNCVYQGISDMKGTLAPDSWTYFMVDLYGLSFNKSCGLTLYPVQLTTNSNINVYMESGQLPDASTTTKKQYNCTGTPDTTCYFFLDIFDGLGVCDSSKTQWYIGFQNVAPNNITFDFQVSVQWGAGTFLGCDFGATLGKIIIIILVSLGVCCFLVIVSVVVCCALGLRHTNRHHRTRDIVFSHKPDDDFVKINDERGALLAHREVSIGIPNQPPPYPEQPMYQYQPIPAPQQQQQYRV